MTNEIMTMNDNGMIANLTTAKQCFSSLTADTRAEKTKLYRAMNNPDKRLGDCINMKINVKDVYVEIVQCTQRETGEVKDCPRTVVIDDNGISYQAVSLGIFSSLSKLFQLFGMPTWEEPIPVIVKQVSKGDRKMLTLDLSE